MNLLTLRNKWTLRLPKRLQLKQRLQTKKKNLPTLSKQAERKRVFA